ncbi:hypothetical protein [Mycolicibacterium canariasense]|nr:hypothetical protein [Mycolicibacterium canariasense]
MLLDTLDGTPPAATAPQRVTRRPAIDIGVISMTITADDARIRPG